MRFGRLRSFFRTTFFVFFGYLIFGFLEGEKLKPYSKGLAPLQHFLIHYVVGIFFGFIIIYTLKFLNRPRVEVSKILSLALLWSITPDILFIFHPTPHPDWMVIFFLHTLVDNTFLSFWIFLVIDILFFFFYFSSENTRSVSLYGKKKR